jgi:hypothetical protein
VAHFSAKSSDISVISPISCVCPNYEGSSQHHILPIAEILLTRDYHMIKQLFWHDVLLSLCKQASNLSIGYNLISTCTGACDWLSRRKCTCWWIIVYSNLAITVFQSKYITVFKHILASMIYFLIIQFIFLFSHLVDLPIILCLKLRSF